MNSKFFSREELSHTDHNKYNTVLNEIAEGVNSFIAWANFLDISKDELAQKLSFNSANSLEFNLRQRNSIPPENIICFCEDTKIHPVFLINPDDECWDQNMAIAILYVANSQKYSPQDKEISNIKLSSAPNLVYSNDRAHSIVESKYFNFLITTIGGSIKANDFDINDYTLMNGTEYWIASTRGELNKELIPLTKEVKNIVVEYRDMTKYFFNGDLQLASKTLRNLDQLFRPDKSKQQAINVMTLVMKGISNDNDIQEDYIDKNSYSWTYDAALKRYADIWYKYNDKNETRRKLEHVRIKLNNAEKQRSIKSEFSTVSNTDIIDNLLINYINRFGDKEELTSWIKEMDKKINHMQRPEEPKIDIMAMCNIRY